MPPKPFHLTAVHLLPSTVMYILHEYRTMYVFPHPSFNILFKSTESVLFPASYERLLLKIVTHLHYSESYEVSLPPAVTYASQFDLTARPTSSRGKHWAPITHHARL